MEEVDVLIVGLSISGITLVKEITVNGQADVKFAAIEVHEGPFRASKATGLHPWTTAAIEHWGLADKISENSTKLLGKKTVHAGKVEDVDPRRRRLHPTVRP